MINLKIKFVKILVVTGLCLFMVLSVFSCKGKENPSSQSTRPDSKSEIRVVCSFLPVWVFTKNVVGNRQGVEVDVLIPGHQGPHDYQLTPGDMEKIAGADLFVINGFYLEEFIVDSVKKAVPDLKILEAAHNIEPLRVDDSGLSVIEDKQEHVKHEGHHHGEHGINEHVFASPRQAAKMVKNIAEALSQIDPAGKDEYIKNAQIYAAQLENIADEIKKAVDEAPNKKIVTFHNAFAYLAQDSGLEIVGVIQTAPGQSPSAGELARLIDLVKSSGAICIYNEPQFSPRLTKLIAEEANIRFDTLDPGATGELETGHYEKVMKKNAETLKRTLGKKTNE